MLEGILASSSSENPFTSYSMEHLITIFIFFLGIFFLFVYRTKLNEKMTSIVFLSVVLFFEIGYHLWLINTSTWDVSHALPLQLCSISLILCIFLLITKNKVIFEIVYFIGIAGAIQAIFTPELFFNFPHLRFFHFFVNHSLIIWIILFFVWSKGYTVTFSSVFKSLAFLQAVALIAFLINIITGGNYMFLAGKPKMGSALDYLGDYPWYILSLEAIAIVLFVILYLPFMKTKYKTRR